MGSSINADIEDDHDEEVHEINLTPFIDVMLVLLIILMVAALLSTMDLLVDLPSSSTAPTNGEKTEFCAGK
jgi:biopolymer transport protein ExbD